jgi:5-methylcytosine-specific restriction enzyme subunit McrC
METLQLSEYASRRVSWKDGTRQALRVAAEGWAQAHSLPSPPLTFGGVDGCTVSAAQYVGVVEAGGVRVEIYPKLDAALLAGESVTASRARSVMSHLLWLLESSGYGSLVDAGEASVEECPDGISDLLAWLFARRLRAQLALGMPQEHTSMKDDLPLVRGRIDFARQSTVLFGRPDVIACGWDEFSMDTPLARLLRCATEVLLARTRLAGAAADLRDALAMFEEVSTTLPALALAESSGIRWSRLNLRWKLCHDLAQAVLRGLGRDLRGGGSESFVYLLDMNELFECHCARWLERRFGVHVKEQEPLGFLLRRKPRGLKQIADFVWRDCQGRTWVGDAKYKIPGSDWPKIEDTRQLICYGQLAALGPESAMGGLMLLHPTVHDEQCEEVTTFDDQLLRLQAVKVVR